MPQQSSTLLLRREVADRFGVLPNFFCSADAAPGLIDELWKFAKAAYLDSPLPSLFKERLFVHLSRFCEIRYCIVRHVGFLIGQGRPAGDADAESETVEQVVEMLRRPLPDGPALTIVLERLQRVSFAGRLPEPRTEPETDLFDALTIMFLSPRGSARARAAVRAAVGDAIFEVLVAYLAFIRTAHYWTEMHPELTYEPDMAGILRRHGELATLLLDTSEAELVQGGLRLRDTLSRLKRAEVALQESESRHAFLLRLGEALRRLIEPRTIQEESSRLLGERLLAERAYYAEIDEAHRCVRVERDFVGDGVSSLVGTYPLADFNWVGWTLRTGGPVVVADADTSPLIPDANRPALTAAGGMAFVAAPLIRDGRPVGALVVTDRLPRDWTPDEVELVKETAEQTWDAIQHARAAEQLRQIGTRKDEFLAMLGHELRNPLAPILTALELMKLRGADSFVRERDVISRQVRHVSRLVDDMLDVSRIARGAVALDKQPLEMIIAIAKAIEIAEPLIDQRAHTLAVDVPQTGLLVDADPDRLSQVFANLLTNSARYTDPGGRIAIQGGRDDHEVWIDVVDSGVGLSPELLPRVFDLFVQGAQSTDRSHGGLGLGLALVQNLVKLHGGAVSAHSEGLGTGSRFRVRLPLSSRATTASLEDAGPPVAVPVAGAASRRILLVDDNADAVDMLRDMLVTLGYEVVVAYDGPQALLALETFDADVAVVDIGLPLMDGYELAQRIRTGQERRVPRLVAMTGYGQADDWARSRDAGFSDHLVKPVDMAALIGSFGEPECAASSR